MSSLLPLARWIYGSASYYVLGCVLLLWCLTLAESLRREAFSWGEFWRRGRFALAVGLAAAALVFLSVRPRLRVLSDETNLLGVAKSFVTEKSAYNPTMGTYYFGSFHPIQREVEKRGLLFPFLVHIVHLSTGYRWQNGFALNFLLLAAFLAGLFSLFADRGGTVVGLSAIVLVLACPLFTLCAASSGAEPLYACGTFLLLAAAARYLQRPGPESFAFLAATALAYCHIRYEAFAIAALALGGAVALAPFERAHVAGRRWLFAVAPALLLPIVAQRLLTGLGSEVPAGIPTFGVGYVWRHLAEIFRVHLTLYDREVPYAIAMDWVSAACLASWIAHRRHGDAAPAWEARWRGLALACLGVQTGIFLAYWMGPAVCYAHPASARFFLIPSIIAAILPAAFHLRFPERLPKGALLALALAGAAFYHPIAVGAWHTDLLILDRETEVCRRFIERIPEPEALFIHGRPGQITVLGRGAIDFRWANANAPRLMTEYGRRLYPGVYALQRIAYDTGAPAADERLDAPYELETLEELQVDAEHTLRFSRVRPPSFRASTP